MKFITAILVATCTIIISCGDNVTNTNTSGYTVTDELYYEKTFDSVYNNGIMPIAIFIPLKMKRVKFVFDFNSNRSDTCNITIFAGHENYWWDKITIPGHYEIEHEFPYMQDSTIEYPYGLLAGCDTCYAVVKNLKVYRSY